MKAIISLLPLLLLSFFSFGQSSPMKEIKFTTSAQCGMCKARIEGAVKKVKGVKSVACDLNTKEVTVAYNSSKTNETAIKTAVTLVGYDAGDMPADNAAYNKLDKCCQKPQGQ